jgi:hypothetical protein
LSDKNTEDRLTSRATFTCQLVVLYYILQKQTVSFTGHMIIEIFYNLYAGYTYKTTFTGHLRW